MEVNLACLWLVNMHKAIPYALHVFLSNVARSNKSPASFQQTFVCGAAQEAGVPHCEFIDRKKELGDLL